MISKTTLNLRKLLPDIPDCDDNCVAILIDKIAGFDGIITVHLQSKVKDAELLEIEFETSQYSESDIIAMALKAGEEITENVGHLLVELDYITHPQQASTVNLSLNNKDGIYEAEAGANGQIRVEFDRKKLSESVILKELQKFDTNISIISSCCHNGHDDHTHDHKIHTNEVTQKATLFSRITSFLKEDTDLVFAILSGVTLTTGWLISFFDLAPYNWSLSFFILAYFFGGYYTSIDVYHSLKNKKFDIHLLMLIAAIGAATLGAWAEGALLLFLFSLGHSLEHYAMGKARKAISALSDLTPKTALVKRDGNQISIPIDDLKKGDLIIIKPGERSPADGFVVSGNSSMDQAPITGESVPVDKYPVNNPEVYRSSEITIPAEHQIFAGSINGDDLLEVEVVSTPQDSTIARVIKLVREAETQKSPTQRFAERFERWFVPAILIFVSLLLFAWVIIDESFSESFYRAMAVMVAASPCALAISTPSAVLSGIARSAKLGVLVKGGGPLELLSEIDTIAFDKTGTITEGNPIITHIYPAQNTTQEELIGYAVAVEEKIDHPIARAIVRDARKLLSPGFQSPVIASVKSISGKGIKATSGDNEIRIGNSALFYDQLSSEITAKNEELMDQGKTTMIIKKNDQFLGIIGLMDVPRSAAKDVITTLRSQGIQSMIMISGDHQKIADQIGTSIGLNSSKGGLLPQDKAQIIRSLTESGAKVAMVGDGVNDAPAMAHATVGIAMGAAGSDVALETADIALMGDDLSKLPLALRLSKATRNIIKQNLFISLGMIAFLVPVTLVGYATMGIAVLLHEGSTLVVVLNALRLLRFKE